MDNTSRPDTFGCKQAVVANVGADIEYCVSGPKHVSDDGGLVRLVESKIYPSLLEAAQIQVDASARTNQTSDPAFCC